MESGQSTACAEAFAFKLAENEEHVWLTGTYIMDEFHYGSVKKALVFWKTIRDLRRTENEDELWAVLKRYSTHENILWRTVAKLESLPTRVFRRVLWFYNIDYQSLESCLRRLTLEQMSGISETYEDLFGCDPKVPRCFTEGLYNLVQQHNPWKRVAVEDLLNEEESDGSCYEAKGAIAFNFFGWDIGFHKYPKEKTDEMLADTLAETFHSLHSAKVDEEKNFTTNKGEGGIYFFLYKTLRYNYLWRRNEKVVFDDKICPGIRYTVAAWIIFLFLSPLAFYISVFGVHHGTHWHSYLRDALGLVTPGIFIAAGVKYVMFKICHGMELGGDWIEEHFEEVNIDKKYWKELGIFLVAVFASTAVVGGSCFLWTELREFFLGSIFSATLSIIFLWLYVFHMVHYEKWMWPTSVTWIGKPAVLFLVFKVLEDYHRDILGFLVAMKHLLAVTFIAVGEHIPMTILAVWAAGFFFAWQLISRTINHFVESTNYSESEAAIRAERFYSSAVYATWILVIAYFAGSIVFLQTIPKISWHAVSFPVIFLALFFGCIVFFEFFMMNALEPRGLMNQRKITTWQENRDDHYRWKREVFSKIMAKNRWVRTLENPLPVVGKLWKFAERFLCDDDYRELLSIDEKGFSLLGEYRKGLDHYHGFNPLEVIRFMVQGKPFKEAIKILSEEREKEQNFRRKLLRAYDVILGRIVRPVHKVLSWFWMMIFSAQRIWKEFNEMCPLETPTKEIK